MMRPESTKIPTPAVHNSVGFKRATVSFRARGRRGEGLASARDRQRLRERNAAERERVERMLASTPTPVDSQIPPRIAQRHLRSPPSWSSVDPITECPVCRDSRVVTDEVMHSGRLLMSECLHCDHRWTLRLEAPWTELGARMKRVPGPRALADR